MQRAIAVAIVMALLTAGCIGQQKTVFVEYQPKQCIQEPWGEKSEEAAVSFLTKNGVEVVSMKIIESNEAVCLACEICPKPYRYVAEVKEKDLKFLLTQGWELVNEPNGST